MRKKGGGKSSKLESNLMINPNSKLEKELGNMSHQELKELLIINMYKMALLRAQLEAITKVLVKNKITTHEEIWKDTNEHFQDSI